MNVFPMSLITADLLSCAVGALLMLMIIAFIACPLIWSRDPERQDRSREALRLLVCIFTGRRPDGQQ